jgi:hypothetical protein
MEFSRTAPVSELQVSELDERVGLLTGQSVPIFISGGGKFSYFGEDLDEAF